MTHWQRRGSRPRKGTNPPPRAALAPMNFQENARFRPAVPVMPDPSAPAAPAVHEYLKIPTVRVEFERGDGTPAFFETDCAPDIFRTLANAAELKLRVVSMTIEGRPIDANSLHALNAYLRTPRALNWNGVLPFNRIRSDRSRWAWSMFLAYLDVTFS